MDGYPPELQLEVDLGADGGGGGKLGVEACGGGGGYADDP